MLYHRRLPYILQVSEVAYSSVPLIRKLITERSYYSAIIQGSCLFLCMLHYAAAYHFTDSYQQNASVSQLDRQSEQIVNKSYWSDSLTNF